MWLLIKKLSKSNDKLLSKFGYKLVFALFIKQRSATKLTL